MVFYRPYTQYPKTVSQAMVTTWQTEKNKVPWIKGMKVWRGTPHAGDMQKRIEKTFRESTIKGNELDVHVSPYPSKLIGCP